MMLIDDNKKEAAPKSSKNVPKTSSSNSHSRRVINAAKLGLVLFMTIYVAQLMLAVRVLNKNT
jgi:multisubunit Na+/H+ antiporter MnhE subunit